MILRKGSPQPPLHSRNSKVILRLGDEAAHLKALEAARTPVWCYYEAVGRAKTEQPGFDPDMQRKYFGQSVAKTGKENIMRAIIMEKDDHTLRVIEVAQVCFDPEVNKFLIRTTFDHEWKIKMDQIYANQASEELFTTGMVDLRMYEAE